MTVHRGHPESHHSRRDEGGANPPRLQRSWFAPTPDDASAHMRSDRNEGRPYDHGKPRDHQAHPRATIAARGRSVKRRERHYGAPRVVSSRNATPVPSGRGRVRSAGLPRGHATFSRRPWSTPWPNAARPPAACTRCAGVVWALLVERPADRVARSGRRLASVAALHDAPHGSDVRQPAPGGEARLGLAAS